MTNLKELPKIKVKESDIGMMLRFVTMEYPEDAENYSKLAAHVFNNFDVICTEEDIKKYEQLYILHEDHELESRRQEYGCSM